MALPRQESLCFGMSGTALDPDDLCEGQARCYQRPARQPRCRAVILPLCSVLAAWVIRPL